jgi:hypothetical protein
MFSTKPVVEWSEELWTIDMPHDYFIIFGAVIGTVFTISMPYFIANFLMNKLAYGLLKPDQADFIMKSYMPELHDATKHLSTTQEEKTSLFEKLTGCLIKLLYAFLYQEHYVPVPELWTPIGLEIGAYMMPFVNAIADDITHFPNDDQDVKSSKNVYPGDSYCNTYQAHSLWHEQSANGLLELVYVADYINSVLQAAQDRYE